MKQIKERNLNKNNKTPLHFAAGNDSIKIGELLISLFHVTVFEKDEIM